MRLAIIKAATLEIQHLRMSSDNLMLIRAINQDTQVKEIHGIVCDIHNISSAFDNISFSHIHRDLKDLNGEVNALAKTSLRAISV